VGGILGLVTSITNLRKRKRNEKALSYPAVHHSHECFRQRSIETPPAGSPLRRAILDGFRASKPMQELSQGLAREGVFTEVNIRRSGDWAWVSAVPTSQKDSTNKVEPNSAVMRKSQDNGQWWNSCPIRSAAGGGSTQGNFSPGVRNS